MTLFIFLFLTILVVAFIVGMVRAKPTELEPDVTIGVRLATGGLYTMGWGFLAFFGLTIIFAFLLDDNSEVKFDLQSCRPNSFLAVIDEYANPDRYWLERIKEAEQKLDVEGTADFIRLQMANETDIEVRDFMQMGLDQLIKDMPRMKREAEAYLDAASRCQKLMTKNQ